MTAPVTAHTPGPVSWLARRAARPVLIIVACAALLAVVAPRAARSAVPPSAPPAFELRSAGVTPSPALFAGRPVRIEFLFAAAGPVDVQVEFVRESSSRVVRRLALAGAVPGTPQRVEWDGVSGSGEVAPAGRYRVRLVPAGAPPRLAGRFTLRSHVYPVRGPHVDRGPIGRFGVGRSGGRTHEGFDINAACGTPLVAARGGRVVRSDYDPVLYGNLVIIRGLRTQRDYWYAHLRRASRLRVGDGVLTGERIGSIGATGNARAVGCHLHFEIRSRRVPIDPQPELADWDRYS